MELNERLVTEKINQISNLADEVANLLIQESENYIVAIEKGLKISTEEYIDKLIYSKIHQRMVKEKPTSEVD